jgi:hypothetical protein
VFVIMAIYMLINYCLVQAKVSYAINTTAKEMSQSCGNIILILHNTKEGMYK